MKLSLLLLASTFLSISAHSAGYQNRISNSGDLDCKAITEGQVRVIISTNDAILSKKGIVTGLNISSQVQIEDYEVKRKYVINDLQFYDGGSYFGKNRPTFVRGSHPKTGEKILIEVQRTGSNDEFQPSKLTIGGKVQDHTELKCRVMFAG